MRYHNITNDDMKNGTGLRTVLWVAGCDHACENCHNPETWDSEGGIPFLNEDKEELFKYLSLDYISGLTLSGGDPLYLSNRADLTKLCKEVKERFPEKTIWMYTGYLYEDIKELSIMQYIDVLVDGPYVDSLNGGEKLKWRGSSNQRVIDLKATRENDSIILLN